eukprot:scaffold122818_cov41-Cyclotella_meneghiniana.AAC.4
MAASSSSSLLPSFLSTFTSVENLWWQNIEPCLAPKDTISVAQTCKDINRLIVDENSRKIKVSHLTSLPSYRLLRVVLRHLYLPSLKRLHVPPRVVSSYRGDVRPDTTAIRVFFEEFVACLPLARNIECLKLDNLDFMITAEETYAPELQELRGVLNTLRHELQHCFKLKELIVNFSGEVLYENEDLMDDDDEPFFNQDMTAHTFYSVILMRALTPAIVQRKDDLERLEISIRAEGYEYENRYAMGDQTEIEKNAAESFFRAILLAREKLKHLKIHIIGSNLVMNSLLHVAGETSSDKHRLSLEYLDLYLRLSYDRHQMSAFMYVPPVVLPVAPLLEHISSTCPSLQCIDLCVPREFWGERDCGYTLGKLTKNSSIKKIKLDFFDDRDSIQGPFYQNIPHATPFEHGDEVMLFLLDLAIYYKDGNSRCCIGEVIILNLLRVHPVYVLDLIQRLESVGLSLVRLSSGLVDSGEMIEEPNAMSKLANCTGDESVVLLYVLFRTADAKDRYLQQRSVTNG